MPPDESPYRRLAKEQSQPHREQLARATKRTVRDILGDRDGVDWAYTVHMEGGDRPHAHVVATGKANERGYPLWLDEDDLERLSDRADEQAKEQERQRPRVLERDRERERREREREREKERDRDRGYSLW